jgi:hypothetical protein
MDRLRSWATPSAASQTPLSLRRQSRRIFHFFIRGRACSTRAPDAAVDGAEFLLPGRHSGAVGPLPVRHDQPSALVPAIGHHGGSHSFFDRAATVRSCVGTNVPSTVSTVSGLCLPVTGANATSGPR